MSYLAEIMACAGQAEMTDLTGKIIDINKVMSALKVEVIEIMDNSYIKFVPVLEEENLQLVAKARKLSTDMELLQSRVDTQIKRELANSTGELEHLKTAFQESLYSLQLVNVLLKIKELFKSANEEQNLKNYVEAAKKLKIIQDDLFSNNKDINCLDIFKSLKAKLSSVQTMYLFDILEIWNTYITWYDHDLGNKSKKVTLSVSVSSNKTEVVKALYHYENLILQIKKFSDKLYNDILCPIIMKQTQVNVADSNQLNVKILSKFKKPDCIDVLNNLTVVFNFLYTTLDIEIDESTSFITELGVVISKDFCDFLIKNCLSESVPTSRDQLEGYRAVIEAIIMFEDLLSKNGFLTDGNKAILNYATNIDTLFADKTCERYLVAARNIMKKDLHNTLQVGHMSTTAPEDVDHYEMDHTVHLNAVSADTFQFPSCQISKSAEELLELVHDILEEAVNSTDRCAVKLFYTARNIFKIYCSIVPEFHKKLLETIPQQSALFHNNCMYLAHKLQILTIEFKEKFPPVLQRHTTTFVDLVNPLRMEASKVFCLQMETQRKQIMDILRDSGLVNLSDNREFPQGVEKALRQCLRQLAHLQTVWQHILPTSVYCKSMGLLCKAFLQELIQKVCTAEAIPEETASQLVIVFNIIQQKAPLYFPEPKEVHRHVKCWTKFNELVRLLGASLREVSDRWSDGKGPLAQEFTPEQVKQLVRALFQTSDRRAALLARIK